MTEPRYRHVLVPLDGSDFAAAAVLDGAQEEQPTGLIAVTTHARTGLQRAVFGAGAAAMVQWSRSPALVVPISPA
jgi:nucleotide-binding universal stress UspA family protein